MKEMPSALECLSGVLFEGEARSTWESASSDQRAQILRDSGLEDVPTDDLSEAMQLLVDELPADQAIAVSETMVSQPSQFGDGISLLDHYVTTVEVPMSTELGDEFDQDAAVDAFGPMSSHSDLPLEIELGEEFDLEHIEEMQIDEAPDNDLDFGDVFAADTIDLPVASGVEFEDLEVDEADVDIEFDLGE